MARQRRYNKNTGFMGTAGLVTRHSGEQGLHNKRRKTFTFTASRRDSQRQENRGTQSWGFKPKGARGGGGRGWSGPGTGVRSLRLRFGSGSGVWAGSGFWGGLRSLGRVWGLDQGSALVLGLGQGFGPESRIWAGSGVSVCVGFQSPGWVWGLSLRLSPESGVSVTVLGRGPGSRSPAAALPRTPHGPCSHRPGDGQRHGPMGARGGAARPMGSGRGRGTGLGGRAESPGRRRPRRSGYLKKRVRYIWCAS